MRHVRTLGAVAVFALVLAAVGALALGTAPTALGQTNTTELANETVAVDNETRALYVEAENTTGDLTVTVYSINSTDDSETQVATGTLNASGADATDLYEYSGVDAANYSEYRVVVEGDDAELITIGVVAEVATGGGGFAFDGGSLSDTELAIGAIAVVGLLALVMRRD